MAGKKGDALMSSKKTQNNLLSRRENSLRHQMPETVTQGRRRKLDTAQLQGSDQLRLLPVATVFSRGSRPNVTPEGEPGLPESVFRYMEDQEAQAKRKK